MGHNREPNDHTCPDINYVIRNIKFAIQEAEYKNTPTVEQFEDRCSNVCSYLSGLDKRLEDLRNDNSQLRTWGADEAERVDDLAKENSILKDELSLIENSRTKTINSLHRMELIDTMNEILRMNNNEVQLANELREKYL